MGVASYLSACEPICHVNTHFRTSSPQPLTIQWGTDLVKPPAHQKMFIKYEERFFSNSNRRPGEMDLSHENIVNRECSVQRAWLWLGYSVGQTRSDGRPGGASGLNKAMEEWQDRKCLGNTLGQSAQGWGYSEEAAGEKAEDGGSDVVIEGFVFF